MKKQAQACWEKEERTAIRSRLFRLQFALGCIVVPARAFLSYLVTILYFKH